MNSDKSEITARLVEVDWKNPEYASVVHATEDERKARHNGCVSRQDRRAQMRKAEKSGDSAEYRRLKGSSGITKDGFPID